MHLYVVLLALAVDFLKVQLRHRLLPGNLRFLRLRLITNLLFVQHQSLFRLAVRVQNFQPEIVVITFLLRPNRIVLQKMAAQLAGRARCSVLLLLFSFPGRWNRLQEFVVRVALLLELLEAFERYDALEANYGVGLFGGVDLEFD
uniref:(northern house mosquito) hypothetical protein n=1 Tax=Culex pipiens TaxID=7175 RepID=A0A8D8CPN3_CULPI